MSLSAFYKVIKSRTKSKGKNKAWYWNKYHLASGSKVLNDNAIIMVNLGDSLLSSQDKEFIALMGTHADLIAKVIRAADKVDADWAMPGTELANLWDAVHDLKKALKEDL